MATREEELQELAELEELERLEALEAQSLASQEPVEEAPVEEEAPNFTTDQAKAAGLGALESVPFAKDVAAGAEAVYQEITEDNEFDMSEMTDKYRKNMREWNEAINEAEEKYPVTFTTADIATGVGLGMLTGGTSLGANIALGAVEGVSRSEDRGFEDAIAGGVIGGVADRVSFGASKALKYFGKKLGLISSRGIGEGIGALNKTKVKELDNHIRKMYLGGDDTKTLSKGYEKFAQDMLAETDEAGKPFFGALQTLTETQTAAAKNLERYGRKMGEVLKEADTVLDNIDTKKLHFDMIDSVVDPLKMNPHPDAQYIGQNLERKINSIFFDEVEDKVTKTVVDPNSGGLLSKEITENVPKRTWNKIKLKDLHDIKVYLSRQARNAFDKEGREISTEALELRKQVGIISDFIDDSIEKSGVEIPNAKTYKDLKKKWSNMLITKQLAADEAANRATGPYGMLKNMLSLRGFFIASTIGGSTGGVGGVALATMINEAMTSSRVPLALAKGASKLANHLQEVPNSKYAKRIVVAGALSADKLREEIESSIAEINLSESPVKRTYADAESKRSSIVTAIRRINPEMAEALDVAFQESDSGKVSQIMDTISKDPETKGLIEQGIGWDGFVFSDEDVEAVEDEIRASRLPAAQEVAYLEELYKQRKIPQYEEKEPFRRLYQPRDKSKHKY